MSFVLTTITTKSKAGAQFLRDLPATDPLRVQSGSVIELKAAAPGYVKSESTVSADGQQVSNTEVWVSKEQHARFTTANQAAIDAWREAIKGFNAAQGNVVVSNAVAI